MFWNLCFFIIWIFRIKVTHFRTGTKKSLHWLRGEDMSRSKYFLKFWCWSQCWIVIAPNLRKMLSDCCFLQGQQLSSFLPVCIVLDHRPFSSHLWEILYSVRAHKFLSINEGSMTWPKTWLHELPVIQWRFCITLQTGGQ